MNSQERRELENNLMVMGLGGLDDPNLVAQMATLINVQRIMPPSDFLRDMLGECEPEKRREMYEALRPHLRFTVKPLDAYMDEIKSRAASIASHDEPVEIGEKKYQEVSEADADAVVAEFTCRRCTYFRRYLGETFVDAVIMGRADGWTRDLVNQREICPKCSAVVN